MPAKYSFLLPAYKGRYLREMLMSIRSQTYSDFEVIVSDDCSPDDLFSIVEPFLEDSRFKYRRNQKNIGAENLVDHWNFLLSLTDAKYIIMTSDDDVFSCNYLADIDILVKKYPNISLFRPRIKRISSDGSFVNEECLFDEVINVDDFCYLWSRGIMNSGVPYYVFKNSELRNAGGFVAFPYAWFSDDATVLKLLSKSEMAITSDVLFSFRESKEQISSKKDDNCSRGKLIAGDLFYDFMKGLPLSSDTKKSICFRLRLVEISEAISSSFYNLMYVISTSHFLSIRNKIRLVYDYFVAKIEN